MAAQTYSLEFNGYRLASNSSGLLARSGIFCVYACVYNTKEDMVSLNRLLYIGEAAHVRDRVWSHEKWPKWWNQLRTGEEICFSVAPIVGESNRQRAEAAMIFEHKPPCNTEYLDTFPFDSTTVTTIGKNALLHSSFSAYTT